MHSVEQTCIEAIRPMLLRVMVFSMVFFWYYRLPASALSSRLRVLMTQLPKHITYSQQSTLYTDESRCPPSVLLTNNSAETK